MDVANYFASMNREAWIANQIQIMDRIPGFLSLKEGYALFKLAETWPLDGDIIEIGSFKGRSTCFLGTGCRVAGKGRVIAVDHFRGSPEHQKGAHEETREIVEDGTTFGAFQNHISVLKLSDIVTPMSGASQDVSHRYDGQARLLFIDGDHSYEGTKNDYEAWEPRVRKFGVICFHDYENSHYLDGVTRFIDTEILPSERLKFINRVDSMMIFVKMVD